MKEIKEVIKIIEPDLKVLYNYKEDIINLMKNSMEISFPNTEVDDNKIFQRFNSLYSYIEEQKGYVLFGMKNKVLLGYVWFFVTNSNRIHINQIIVSPESRGLGIGIALMQDVYKFANKHGISEVELKVTKSNERAVDFYNKQNFTVERILMKRRV